MSDASSGRPSFRERGPVVGYRVGMKKILLLAALLGLTLFAVRKLKEG